MTDRYPDEPGCKGLTHATFDTSAEAAEAIAPRRLRLAFIALRTIASLGAATPFEAAAASGVKASALSPRLSELIAEGMVKPSGERRRNPETGKSAAVLMLTDLAQARLKGGAA